MSIVSLPKQVLVGALTGREGPELDRAVTDLISWWNACRDDAWPYADHLAAYVCQSEGWWRNALWEDPTEYWLSRFDEERSSARSGDVIVEFRILHDVDGQMRSSPVAAIGSYLLIKPDDALAWSIQAVREIKRHLVRRSSFADAAGMVAYP